MVDFSKILDKKVEDIETPKPLPAGTYVGVIASAPEDASFKTKDNQTGAEREVAACRFPISLREALDDVDEDALSAAGGLTRNDGKPKQVQATYYLEEESLYKMKKLGETCGITGDSLREIFENLAGSEVKVNLGLRPDKNDPEIFYNQVNKVVGTAA